MSRARGLRTADTQSLSSVIQHPERRYAVLERLDDGEAAPVRRGERVYVPLYHPAAALYNATLMDTLEADMRRVREYLADAEAERSRRAAAVPIGAAADDAASTDQLALFE